MLFRSLEINSLSLKAETILLHMDSELQLLELKGEIESKVRVELDKQQRDYFLSQQLKTIQDELGGNPQEEDLMKLAERARKKDWSIEVKNILRRSGRRSNGCHIKHLSTRF